jgi:hypothetical protein
LGCDWPFDARHPGLHHPNHAGSFFGNRPRGPRNQTEQQDGRP